MKETVAPMDLTKLKVRPLAERRSLTRIEDILVDPNQEPNPIDEATTTQIAQAGAAIKSARSKDAAVLLIFGAHLVRNGAARIIERMLENGWLTHLATNGAGAIHDWEYAFQGRSTESVVKNVATGSFGTWDETGRYLHLALLAGNLADRGFGASLGKFIDDGKLGLPSSAELQQWILAEPCGPNTAAWAELLWMRQKHGFDEVLINVQHRWKASSILRTAYRLGVPLTVHPGIGYDIIANHPMFNGAVIGRAAEMDFRLFASSVDRLDGGVVLNIGSAIMGPQVFEKSLSCVNNLRLQAGRPVVSGHEIFVVDIQDGGQWDWTVCEPLKTNPAYYLRFCKSFSRMGGRMQYIQCDNVTFLHHLYRHFAAQD